MKRIFKSLLFAVVVSGLGLLVVWLISLLADWIASTFPNYAGFICVAPFMLLVFGCLAYFTIFNKN